MSKTRAEQVAEEIADEHDPQGACEAAYLRGLEDARQDIEVEQVEEAQAYLDAIGVDRERDGCTLTLKERIQEKIAVLAHKTATPNPIESPDKGDGMVGEMSKEQWRQWISGRVRT